MMSQWAGPPGDITLSYFRTVRQGSGQTVGASNRCKPHFFLPQSAATISMRVSLQNHTRLWYRFGGGMHAVFFAVGFPFRPILDPERTQVGDWILDREDPR